MQRSNLGVRQVVGSACALGLLVVLAGCGGGGGGGGESSSVAPVELKIAGVGPRGIFDPSMAYDSAGGRLWMSYSEVLDSVIWPGQNTAIQTRLAWSVDAGDTWTDAGSPINPAVDLTLPLSPPNDAGTWVQEVSAIVRDPGAPASERWKLVWHRYLQINGARAFQHGWVAMKTAPAPGGPWSSERKLFVGGLYDPVNDSTIGPPEVKVQTLHADLAATAAVSEPGLLATPTALYVTALAAGATSQTGRIALLKWAHPSGPWTYQGSFLLNAVDGPSRGYDGYSAPELVEVAGTVYLLVTPQIQDKYLGTLVFKVTDLDTATLERAGGVPVSHLEVFGTPGTHNGAAGYVEEATASGLIYSEVDTTLRPLRFRLFKSGRIP